MKKLPKLKESIVEYLQDPENRYLYNLISPKIYQLENLKEQLDYKKINQRLKPFTFTNNLQLIEERIKYEIDTIEGALQPETIEPFKIDLWIGSDLESEFNDLLKPLQMPSNIKEELKPVEIKRGLKPVVNPILECSIKELEGFGKEMGLETMKPVIPSIPMKNTFKRRYKIQGI
ncbi:hypothetical protein HDV01_004396 [Terramyces sp. JEL0728]|nr:hypothetical protein HDV01_004396 [Terramyces sp. JEL0728]